MEVSVCFRQDTSTSQRRTLGGSPLGLLPLVSLLLLLLTAALLSALGDDPLAKLGLLLGDSDVSLLAPTLKLAGLRAGDVVLDLVVVAKHAREPVLQREVGLVLLL